MRRFAAGLAVLAACALSACSSPRTEAPAAAPADLPAGSYRDAAARGEHVYRIDPASSLVTVYVYRDGPLARLGHDHVIAGRGLRGYVQWSGGTDDGRADLLLPVASVTVDEPELRAAAGFGSEPSADEIAGTRANMLASIEADAFPDIGLHAVLLRPPPEPVVSVDLRWHGVTQSFDVPVALTADGARLELSGSFGLSQSAFGISPFSVFGGALSVADRLDVSFRLLGRRVAETSP